MDRQKQTRQSKVRKGDRFTYYGRIAIVTKPMPGCYGGDRVVAKYVEADGDVYVFTTSFKTVINNYISR